MSDPRPAPRALPAGASPTTPARGLSPLAWAVLLTWTLGLIWLILETASPTGVFVLIAWCMALPASLRWAIHTARSRASRDA